jgi:RNA polymerase sigma-70 factor, ECF subfamily
LKDVHGLHDQELVANLRAGDRESGDELYSRYHASVERYCLMLTRDSSSAQDATHEAFLKVLTSVGDLRNGCSFRSWLFRIARNTCLLEARKHSRHLLLEEDDEPLEEVTPLDIALEGELREMIDRAVALLRPVFREALLLREHEGLTYEEIAATTQASLATVKFRIHKARKILTSTLGEYLDERKMP